MGEWTFDQAYTGLSLVFGYIGLAHSLFTHIRVRPRKNIMCFRSSPLKSLGQLGKGTSFIGQKVF